MKQATTLDLIDMCVTAHIIKHWFNVVSDYDMCIKLLTNRLKKMSEDNNSLASYLNSVEKNDILISLQFLLRMLRQNEKIAHNDRFAETYRFVTVTLGNSIHEFWNKEDMEDMLTYAFNVLSTTYFLED